jgi:CheY-like chemotaxis protein
MAQILDGEIVVTSQPGVGSQFTVTLATGLVQDVEMHESLCIAEEAFGQSTSHYTKRSLNGRILLAEDNPVNRRLFEAMLRAAGADVDVAENGQIAIEKAVSAMRPPSSLIATGPGYDLILMDMQMPVLDGYSAAKHLRAIRYQGPIVALTAHALTEDKEKCLAIGCDDVITKPVERDVLIHACHEWIGNARSNRHRTIDIDMERSGRKATVPDSGGIDMQSLMNSISGDMGLLDDLIDVFLSNSTELVREMQQAIEFRDSSALGSAAHSLKGAVSTFSAGNAIHAAMSVECLAREEDLDGATEAFDRLRSELDQLIDELAELRSGQSQPTVGQLVNL